MQRGDRTDLVLTVQFSDVRSFTTITEKLSPGETFDLVGDYLERVCKPVSAHNGFVDKYIGDAVMALFLSADEAMKSCLEQLSALDATNEQRVEKGEISFEVGFGLHTGPVTLGTVGSTERIDCTVLGDSVNLASRIESLTVRYGTRLLVSSSVVDALSSPGDYELREVDRVVVKGKTEPVRLFEVIDALPAERRVQRMAALQSFSAARDALFEGRFEAACELFEGASQADPGDLATELLWKRAMELREAGTTGPSAAVAKLVKK